MILFVWREPPCSIDALAAGWSEYLQDDAELLAEHGIKLPAPSALSKIKRILK